MFISEFTFNHRSKMSVPDDPESIPYARGWNVLPVFERSANGDLGPLLSQMQCDPAAPGFSDVGIRNLLSALILSIRPQAVLEIGTHIGTAAVIMGAALSQNEFGKLYTVEPQQVYQDKARGYIRDAGLEKWVELIPGLSTDDLVHEQFRKIGGFDLIFVDACHSFREALTDIEVAWLFLRPNGIMIFHDTSLDAQKLDERGEGGVRAALLEARRKMKGFNLILLEYPLWLNPCGAAMVCKQML
jgi:predicted O-methyltransferase YrrM